MAVPSDFSGLRGWAKADSESYADGAEVTTMYDRSGGGRNWTVAAGSGPLFKAAVVNGLPAYHFDAEPAYVDGSNIDQYVSSSAFSIYFYFRPTTFTTDDSVNINQNHTIVGVAGISLNAYLRTSLGLVLYHNDGSGVDTVAKAGVNTGSWFLGFIGHTGGNIYVGLDDLTAASLSSTASGNSADIARAQRIGRTNSTLGQFIGYMAELCEYNVWHDEATRAAIQQYFAVKYRLSAPGEAARNNASRRLRLLSRAVPTIQV